MKHNARRKEGGAQRHHHVLGGNVLQEMPQRIKGASSARDNPVYKRRQVVGVDAETTHSPFRSSCANPSCSPPHTWPLAFPRPFTVRPQPNCHHAVRRQPQDLTPSPFRVLSFLMRVGVRLRRESMQTCGVITPLLRLPRRRLRGGSRGGKSGKRSRACCSARRCERRERAAPWPCSSASAASCSYAWR